MSEETNAGQTDEQRAQMTEDQIRERLEDQFRSQNVSDLMVQFLVSLSTLAYVKMGLTEELSQYRDLGEARLAIDSFKALLDATDTRLPDQDAKALAGALASMQMTFVKVIEESGAEAPSAVSDDSGAEPAAAAPQQSEENTSSEEPGKGGAEPAAS